MNEIVIIGLMWSLGVASLVIGCYLELKRERFHVFYNYETDDIFLLEEKYKDNPVYRSYYTHIGEL